MQNYDLIIFNKTKNVEYNVINLILISKFHIKGIIYKIDCLMISFELNNNRIMIMIFFSE
jgi:hypothetical protein